MPPEKPPDAVFLREFSAMFQAQTSHIEHQLVCWLEGNLSDRALSNREEVQDMDYPRAQSTFMVAPLDDAYEGNEGSVPLRTSVGSAGIFTPPIEGSRGVSLIDAINLDPCLQQRYLEVFGPPEVEEHDSPSKDNDLRVSRESSGDLNGLQEMACRRTSSLDGLLRANSELRQFSKVHNATLNKLWLCMSEPESSRAACVFKEAMNPLILISVLVTMAQAVNPSPLSGKTAAILETLLDSFFAMDILLRFLTCPNHFAFGRNVYNIIDIVAVLPFPLRCYAGFILPYEAPPAEWDFVYYVLICLLPILRLMKLLRRFQTFHLILKSFREAFEALPVLLFAMFLIAMFWSSILFIVEPRDNLGSLPEALWLTLVTMMTVGYGDVSPSTYLGKIATVGLMISSILYMAIPIGIIGNAFNRVWEQRHKLLLLHRTRARLHQWGYKPKDIPKLFRVFDGRQAGELDFLEFRRMFMVMRVGLNDKLVFTLFQAFDADGGGTIDEKEFMHELFPDHYFELYGEEHETYMQDRATRRQSTVLIVGEDGATRRVQTLPVAADSEEDAASNEEKAVTDLSNFHL